MTKFRKILSACAVAIAGICALASCGTTSFYEEWKDAGAVIEEDNCFKAVTPDEVKAMADKKESFVVFIGSSKNTTAVQLVSDIQEQADNLYYEGTVYFVNTKDIMSSTQSQKDARAALGTKELADKNGLVVACYKEGTLYFDTSNPGDVTERFMVDGSLDFDALATYVFEYYPVKK